MKLFVITLVSVSLSLVLYRWLRLQKFVDDFLLAVGQTVYKINRYRLSDDEQMRLSQRGALNILGRLTVLTLVIIGLIAVAAAPFLLIDFSQYSMAVLIGWMIIGSIPPILVFYMSRHRESSQEYAPGKQSFFYLTLGAPSVAKVLARTERYVGRPKLSQPKQTLFITGLARAGTTALLQLLNRHPQMWSFTYRHLPFPMSSRLWLVLNRASTVQRERSHQDGIFVGLDSPEAFDEYFWRLLLKERYYHEQVLQAHDLTNQEIVRFERLISTHLDEQQCYLSKNNNFLLRAESYLQHRPETFLLVVYRHFADHAASLHRQHVIQSEAQQQTPFALDYMDMLGHHEFGLHRYDFQFADTQLKLTEPADLNYWLERWIDYYRQVLKLDHERLFIVSNDQIRNQPEFVANRTWELVGLSSEIGYANESELSPSPQKYPSSDFAVELRQDAEEILIALDELNQTHFQSAEMLDAGNSAS